MKRLNWFSFTLVIPAMMLMSFIWHDQSDQWTRKADMPTGRRQHATSVVEGKIFAIGGGKGYDLQPIVEIYDPVSDKWSDGTSMPEPRIAAACAVGGKIYYIGGALTVTPPHPAVGWVEEYTPAQ